jgi:hypothetical protein
MIKDTIIGTVVFLLRWSGQTGYYGVHITRGLQKVICRTLLPGVDDDSEILEIFSDGRL